jgi:TolB-like protein/predicted Ser/Thr protein kinase
MEIGPGTLLNEYQVIRPLGKGGMGEVFLARDTRLDRLAALKILRWETEADADRVRRFAVEARAAAALNHPNLAAVYGIGQHGRVCFIAMEYVTGETLRQAKLDQATAADVIIQAACALDTAHSAGIIHRDVKPANIMRTESGLVKVLDFGLAKRVQTAAVGPGLTETGVVMGTLGYMSPEQLLGRELDRRTDIFSLGIVLYELLAGKIPFAAESYEHALASLTGAAHTVGAPPVSKPLAAVVLKAIERDADRRYQTAADFAAALRTATTEAPAPMVGRASRREWILAGAGTLAGAGLAAFRLRSGPAPEGAINSLAILPFAGGTAAADVDYLREGIAESLMNRLSSVTGLRVVSRDSSFRHRGQAAKEAGRLLGVRGVVAGAIHQVEGSLLVTAELVDASTDQRVWGEEFRCDGSDVLGTRDRIAEKIAGHLKVQLTGSPRETVDPRAHDLYLRGRFLSNRLEADEVRRGLDCLGQAVAIDSGYALAHAAMAEAHLFLADMHQPALEVLPEARKAARRAVEIDPDLADAHVASAMVQMQGDLDWPGAEASLRRAIGLNPNLPLAHGWLGWVLAATGRGGEGLDESRKAVALEPRSPLAHSLLAANLYFAHHYAESFAAAGRALEIDSRFHLALYWRGMAMTARGLPGMVISKIETIASEPNAPPVAIAALGCARAARGQAAKARESLDALTRVAQSRHVSAILFAALHAALLEKDAAMGWLERAYETRARLLLWTRLDPLYDELHGDPRFEALIAKLKL